ncbi:MAG: hypothetical protein V1697_02125 [Candidatus Levyibacteriota bacterium]
MNGNERERSCRYAVPNGLNGEFTVPLIRLKKDRQLDAPCEQIFGHAMPERIAKVTKVTIGDDCYREVEYLINPICEIGCTNQGKKEKDMGCPLMEDGKLPQGAVLLEPKLKGLL